MKLRSRTRTIRTVLIALAVGTSLLVVGSAEPVAASHSNDLFDQAVAIFTGGINLDVDGDDRANADGDFDGDVECAWYDSNPPGDTDDRSIPDDWAADGTCDDDPDEACTTAGGAAGDRAQFTDVLITGVFSAFNDSTSTVGAFAGQLEIDTIAVCAAEIRTTHDLNADGVNDHDNDGNGTNDLFDGNGDGNADIAAKSLQATGSFGAAYFNTLGSGVDLWSGDAVCLFGQLVAGGTFENTGAETSVAQILTNYSIRETDGAGVDPCDTEGGALIAATDGNVRLRADVPARPPWGFGVLLTDPTSPPAPEPVQVDHDVTRCTHEVLIDPFFEIRRSDPADPEPSVCLLLKWPVERSLRLTLREVH